MHRCGAVCGLQRLYILPGLTLYILPDSAYHHGPDSEHDAHRVCVVCCLRVCVAVNPRLTPSP